jgi:hypothetical protein
VSGAASDLSGDASEVCVGSAMIAVLRLKDDVATELSICDRALARARWIMHVTAWLHCLDFPLDDNRMLLLVLIIYQLESKPR